MGLYGNMIYLFGYVDVNTHGAVPYSTTPLNCNIVEEFHDSRQGLANGVSALIAGVHREHNMVLICAAKLENPLLILAS